MGLQSQLNDFSSDSLPLFFLSLLANFLSLLRRSFLSSTAPSPDSDISPLHQHLHLNRLLSHRYYADSAASDCVVCLCPLSAGNPVRRLPCNHIFHKDCLDGWLHHLNFNCPLCRSPIHLHQRVPFTLHSPLPHHVLA
ncbi:E3 ubiquitin-protein ligase RHA2B, partial [Cucurbita argyrosperma subsp. argyrosperma]